MKYLFITLVALAAFFEVFLLFFGYRVLLDEEFYPEHPGIMNSAIYAEEAKFGCTYFTGRKTIKKELWANQYDECPFLWTES